MILLKIITLLFFLSELFALFYLWVMREKKIPRFIIIFFFLLTPSTQAQQTAEKIAADKLSAIDYVNNQVSWLKTYVDAEFGAVRQAVDKVEHTNTAKFESVNEFRSQLKDQAATFITRKELWAAVITVIGFIISASAVIIRYKKPLSS